LFVIFFILVQNKFLQKNKNDNHRGNREPQSKKEKDKGYGCVENKQSFLGDYC
jgi:hypothetical protein